MSRFKLHSKEMSNNDSPKKHEHEISYEIIREQNSDGGLLNRSVQELGKTVLPSSVERKLKLRHTNFIAKLQKTKRFSLYTEAERMVL